MQPVILTSTPDRVLKPCVDLSGSARESRKPDAHRAMRKLILSGRFSVVQAHDNH